MPNQIMNTTYCRINKDEVNIKQKEWRKYLKVDP